MDTTTAVVDALERAPSIVVPLVLEVRPAVVFRHNLIRAENGAIRFVPRIEKRPWTLSSVAPTSPKVLFR